MGGPPRLATTPRRTRIHSDLGHLVARASAEEELDAVQTSGEAGQQRLAQGRKHDVVDGPVPQRGAVTGAEGQHRSVQDVHAGQSVGVARIEVGGEPAALFDKFQHGGRSRLQPDERRILGGLGRGAPDAHDAVP
jgi:hypothetical protein